MASALTLPGTGLHFQLAGGSEAAEPPEVRGLARDQVRLMVAWRHRPDLAHTVFRHLPDYLHAGDLLVVNNSATLPAAVSGRGPDGTAVELHFSTQVQPDRWILEPRLAGLPASRPFPHGEVGMVFVLPGGAWAELLAPSGTPGRLWVAALHWGQPADEYLARFGRPIRYHYVPRDWPLDYYQTVFAQEPGSVEMPSAARPFSAELVTELVSRGVMVAPITLHCAVSSLEAHEAPPAERFSVPPATAELVNQTRRQGGRVIAVGTTVVRALESAAGEDGVHAAGGWTSLVISAERGVRAVDGMITGWHEPEASHLALLAAVGGIDLLARSYRAAQACGYLWHEFGDSHLILP
ncbi:MAG TPA: S-adenosylmethionine:tRNA ribosyltransferase-isomerase [Acidimicrobiales bacterium]|nr:S-adenosylmethionine:tRNA ribosyltransferase-isomerase [Acidimicrobiales bacterium]